MAFPTTGLSDNQVHKEGNRAFVYDSTLGTWDQVKDAGFSDIGQPTLEKVLGNDTVLESSALFPAGHYTKQTQYQAGAGATTQTTAGIGFGTVGSQVMIHGSSVQIIIFGGTCEMEDSGRRNAYLGVNYKWDTTFSSTTDGTVYRTSYFVGTGSSVVKANAIVGTTIHNVSGSTKTLYFRPHAASTNSSYVCQWLHNQSNHAITYLVTYVQ